MATSTLAGEYVTARDYVGGRASGGKFRDEYFLYKKRAKAELCWTGYVLLKRGRLTMELGVVTTRQNFGFLVLLRVLVVVSGQGGTDVDTSAGTLSKAKTQRRPDCARESEREWGFPLLFRCFCIFL